MQNTKRHLLKKAFRIIRRNYGCPGNDGISISRVKKNYNKYENIVWQRLENGIYTFEQEPKCVTIHDYLGKEREIFVYNIIDRWVQEFIRLQIEPIIDITLAEYVYAFRRGKNDVDSYDYILKNEPKFILRTDIKDYFHSINKEKLFTGLESLDLEGSLLKLMKRSLAHCVDGLPSGHVLSCMLSNFYLKDFDFRFTKNYTRYSDDMMFGVQSEAEAYEVLEFITNLLKMNEFVLNSSKTRIILDPTLEKIS